VGGEVEVGSGSVTPPLPSVSPARATRTAQNNADGGTTEPFPLPDLSFSASPVTFILFYFIFISIFPWDVGAVGARWKGKRAREREPYRCWSVSNDSTHAEWWAS
jgi:hypothetical protein